MKMGLPTVEGTFFGPLTRPQQAEVLGDQVSDATSKGAKLLLGGKTADGAGFYYEPTVLTDVNHDMKVMMDESFGPIIGIQKVKDDSEAIQLMTDTPYGLANYVQTLNKERARRVSRQLRSGMVEMNSKFGGAGSPFGGMKQSGNGREGGAWRLEEFLDVKAVSDWR